MAKFFRMLSLLVLTSISVQLLLADGLRKEDEETMTVVDHDDPTAVTETVIERYKGKPKSPSEIGNTNSSTTGSSPGNRSIY